MISRLIINILAVIGTLTLVLIAIAVWVCVTDKDPELRSSIPTLQSFSPTSMRDAEICEDTDKEDKT